MAMRRHPELGIMHYMLTEVCNCKEGFPDGVGNQMLGDLGPGKSCVHQDLQTAKRTPSLLRGILEYTRYR